MLTFSYLYRSKLGYLVKAIKLAPYITCRSTWEFPRQQNSECTETKKSPFSVPELFGDPKKTTVKMKAQIEALILKQHCTIH
jgi:hypothetical protein